jgi:hypothetical protein
MRRALILARCVGIVALASGALTMAFLSATASPDANPEQAVPPPPAEVDVALRRAGFQPEALASAGLSGSETATLVASLEDELTEAPDAIAQSDAALAAARIGHDALKRKIESGQASQEEVASFPAAVQALGQATAQRDLLLEGLFDAATASLAPSKKATLSTMRQARKLWDQDWPYLTIAMGEPERVQLRDALANERIAAAAGEPPDPDAQALLQQVRAIPEVAAAIASLQANLEAVNAAWTAALQ